MDTELVLQSIVVVSDERLACSLGDELAIFSMKNDACYHLDTVGSRVWNLLQQPRSVAEICDAIVNEFEVDRIRCENDLLDLLMKMRAEGLIELVSERR